jgi:hypothetical protein
VTTLRNGPHRKALNVTKPMIRAPVEMPYIGPLDIYDIGTEHRPEAFDEASESDEDKL